MFGGGLGPWRALTSAGGRRVCPSIVLPPPNSPSTTPGSSADRWTSACPPSSGPASAGFPIRGGDRRAVEALIERVLRLGDVGSPNLVGASSQIDADIARRLGEAAGDPRGVYRALRAMLGHTALVVRHSRRIRRAQAADAGR